MGDGLLMRTGEEMCASSTGLGYWNGGANIRRQQQRETGGCSGVVYNVFRLARAAEGLRSTSFRMCPVQGDGEEGR